MKPTKGVIQSKTVWGLLVAGAATIADSADLLSGLVGGEWADKLVVVAGLVMAFYGRIVSTTAIRGLVMVMAAGGMVLIGGCEANTNQRAISGVTGDVNEQLGSANTASWTEAAMVSSMTVPVSQLIADVDGINLQSPGPGTAIGSEEFGAVWSPGDVYAKGVRMEFPDGRSITVEEFSSVKSVVIAAYDFQVAQLSAKITALGEIEARRYVESLVAIGDITASVAEAALLAAFPIP